jgi:hypothetical protein
MHKATRARCAKVMLFAAEPGKAAEYGDYLRASVEPVDRRAVEQGALVEHLTLVNDADPSLGTEMSWTHMRVFLFESDAQRARIKDVFARVAAELEPDEAKRARRKAEGEKLRRLVGELDVKVLDE